MPAGGPPGLAGGDLVLLCHVALAEPGQGLLQGRLTPGELLLQTLLVPPQRAVLAHDPDQRPD